MCLGNHAIRCVTLHPEQRILEQTQSQNPLALGVFSALLFWVSPSVLHGKVNSPSSGPKQANYSPTPRATGKYLLFHILDGWQALGEEKAGRAAGNAFWTNRIRLHN